MTTPDATVSAARARQMAAERGIPHRKARPVTARQATEQATWANDTGQTMHGQPGDWTVTDDDGTWTVADGIFRATYEPLPDRPGLWRKTAVTTLVPMDMPFAVATLEGTATGNAGDFLAVGEHNDAWPISRTHVEQNYEPVAVATRDKRTGQ